MADGDARGVIDAMVALGVLRRGDAVEEKHFVALNQLRQRGDRRAGEILRAVQRLTRPDADRREARRENRDRMRRQRARWDSVETLMRLWRARKAGVTYRELAGQFSVSAERIKQVLLNRHRQRMVCLAYTPPMETDPDKVEVAWMALEHRIT
jgi:hypothetical protein